MTIKINKIAELTGHKAAIYALDSGRHEQLIFSGSVDKDIAQWNLETCQFDKLVARVAAPIYSICHIPEKQWVLAGTSNGTVHIVDLETNREIEPLITHTSQIFCIKYSLKTNCIYTLGGDGYMAVYSLDSLTLIKWSKLSDEILRHLDFNYETLEIATTSGDGNVHIFDLNTLVKKKRFLAHQAAANVARFSPDGKLLFTGGRDGHLNVWDVDGYELIKSIPAHEWAIYDTAFSPDARLIATASRDKSLKIWDSKSFELLEIINKESFDGHQFSVNKLIWSTDYLISASDDRTIMIWDIKVS